MPDIQLEILPSDIISSVIIPPSQISSTISQANDGLLVLLSPGSLTCTIETQVINSTLLVGQGPAGPAGPPGGSEEVATYQKEIDFVGSDVIYKGEAAPGSLISANVWRIKKIQFVAEDISEKWANGSAAFDKVWSDRATYSY